MRLLARVQDGRVLGGGRQWPNTGWALPQLPDHPWLRLPSSALALITCISRAFTTAAACQTHALRFVAQVAYEVLRDPQRRRLYDRGQLAER